MGQVYQDTQLRLETIFLQGYTIVNILEYEWRALKAHDPNITQFIQSLNIQESMVPRDAFFEGPTNYVK